MISLHVKESVTHKCQKSLQIVLYHVVASCHFVCLLDCSLQMSPKYCLIICPVRSYLLVIKLRTVASCSYSNKFSGTTCSGCSLTFLVFLSLGNRPESDNRQKSTKGSWNVKALQCMVGWGGGPPLEVMSH